MEQLSQPEQSIQNSFVAEIAQRMQKRTEEIGNQGAQIELGFLFNQYAERHAEDTDYSDRLEAAERFLNYWVESGELETAKSLYSLFEIRCDEDELFSEVYSGHSIWHAISDLSDRLQAGADLQQNLNYLNEHNQRFGSEHTPWKDGNYILHDGQVIDRVQLDGAWPIAKYAGLRTEYLAATLGLRDYFEASTELTRARQTTIDEWELRQLKEAAGLSTQNRETQRSKRLQRIVKCIADSLRPVINDQSIHNNTNEEGL